MCIAEGEGSRFSALLNSGLFEFQIFTNLATKSGYIKLTEICLYFCPYRKTPISTKSNTLPGISFRTGKYSGHYISRLSGFRRKSNRPILRKPS